jgi:hypothetical protein
MGRMRIPIMMRAVGSKKMITAILTGMAMRIPGTITFL